LLKGSHQTEMLLARTVASTGELDLLDRVIQWGDLTVQHRSLRKLIPVGELLRH
jgi:hypothetical protein